jgi:hypothetical protein
MTHFANINSYHLDDGISEKGKHLRFTTKCQSKTLARFRRSFAHQSPQKLHSSRCLFFPCENVLWYRASIGTGVWSALPIMKP